MGGTLAMLILAAALEIGAAAAIGTAIVRWAWHWMALGQLLCGTALRAKERTELR